MSKGKLAKSIVDMIKEIRETRGGYEAKRLERAADEVPNLEKLYQRDALESLFRGDNAKGIMTMKPGDFERFATPLDYRPNEPMRSMLQDIPKGMTQEQYLNYLAKLPGFETIPWMEISKREGKDPKFDIMGHEGRHRNRALEMVGQPTGIVEFLPRASLREPLPRSNREEYINALNEELKRTDRMVMPQKEGSRGRRSVMLPDVYKSGGPVNMQDGGAATSNEAMLRRSRRTSKYNRDVDFLDAEMLPEEAPPAEMKAYEPTTRQRLGETAERALRTVSTAPRARAIADLLTGGREGAMMSAADLVPFLGTGMAIEEIAPHVKGALSKGNYGEAALYGGLGVASAIPGIPGTVRGAKAIGKAIAPKAGELAEQYMMRTGMALPMDVWHGSPHRFPPAAKNPLGEFDPTKIGTGEGAQAYGHGHYLAEAPKVAKRYVPRDPDYEDKLMRMYKQAERKQDYASMEVLENALIHKTPEELRELHPEHGTLIDKIASIPQKGSLYKVDLPDEQIAKMLDWDKPLSEQSKEARDALAKWVDRLDVNDPEKLRLVDKFDNPKNQNIKFGQLYNEATSSLWGKDTGELSRQLQQSGIPGIKYFDEASRDAGEGTRNFVVFPGGEEMLTIKERMKDGGVAHKAGGGVLRRLAKYGKQYEPSKKTEIFIGEKSPMWNAGAAGKAVELEKAGVSPVDIWKQTGTFRSPDGALRQEISDVGSKFRGEKEMKELAASMKQQEADIKQKIKESKEHPDLFPKQLKTAQGALRQAAKEIKQIRTMEGGPEYRVGLGNKAGFAFEHPELYEAYPKLLDMDVKQGGRYGSAGGSYMKGIDESDPGTVNIYDRGLNRNPRSVMTHEVQHAIQNIEGWGKGGDPTFAFNNPEAFKILKEIREKAAIPIPFDEWAKHYEGTSPEFQKRAYEKYLKNLPASVKGLDREYQEQAARLYYDRLAGEAEARAAQARIDLTPEQRLEKFPLEVGDYGYDVKPEDIIVKRNKKGGQVSLDAMRLAVGGMAEGGIKPTKFGIAKTIVEGIKKKYDALEKAKEAEKSYTTPAAFQRAPAKTKQEIEAIAQRMAPQFLGEFVRKPGKTESVAGKSFKQYKAEQDLPIVYGGARDIPKTVDIESRLGDVMIGVPGDPTIAHRTLEQVGDIKPDIPVELHGGPLYGLKDKFWASDLGAASGLRNLAGRASRAYGDTNVLGQYIRMPEGTPYALHTTDALLSFLRPDMLGKKKLEQLNAEIRRGGAKSKYSFPEFVGFEDIDLALMQAQGNPELRKHINNTLLAPTTTKKYGLYPGKNIEAAITEEPLRNVETGTTGYSIGRLFPEQALTESAHPTYAMDIPGLFLGQTKYPQPYELTFPDTLKYVRENLVPGATEFGTFKMVGPRQIIDPQYVDEIKMYEEAMKKLTGKKKGGPVHKATGGMASAPLKIMRAFVEAGKKAKLAEKSKEAAAKGEVYIPDEETKKAMREALNMPEKPEEYADGGSIAASPTIPGQEFLGKIGQAAERLGIKIEDAMKIVSQEGNSPIKAALTNFLVSDTLKSAGTALQDWTGTPRDATEQYPYRRLMTGKGMTASIDPRIIDVAPIAGAAASRAAHGIKHLPTDVMRAAVEAYGPQATASHVIKPKGGNWLSGDVENRLKRLKNDPVLSGEIINKIANKDLFSEYRKSYEKDPTIGLHDWARSNYPEIYSKTLDPSENALNQWIDKQLTRYVKNEMGTPEDPIRALAEKGTLHYAPQTGYSVAPDLRRAAGMPEGNVATTELGKAWENIADKAILPGTYKTHAPFIMKPGYYSSASEFQDVEKGLREVGGEFAVKNPDAPAYAMNKGVGMEDTGFQHIIDELKNATNPDSGLPRELQLRPESLERLSVPQAVERVAKINEWRAAQKAEADLARANNPATTTFKEYPEGYAWKELKMPEGAEDNKALADALKYEGEQMGHCVGGYCPDVESGQSRIYSLRDEKGVPHVTIEVAPPSIDDYVAANQSDPYRPALDTIVQIKGRGNAKPAEKYLPFVQDFVKSGNWSDIRDFQNTGLIRRGNVFTPTEKQSLIDLGQDVPEYLTQDDIARLRAARGDLPTEGKKRGGRVKSAPSLDAMRLAVMSK